MSSDSYRNFKTPNITETETELHIGNSLTEKLLNFDKSWSILDVQLFLWKGDFFDKFTPCFACTIIHYIAAIWRLRQNQEIKCICTISSSQTKYSWQILEYIIVWQIILIGSDYFLSFSSLFLQKSTSGWPLRPILISFTGILIKLHKEKFSKLSI